MIRTPLLPPCPFRRPEGATFTHTDHPSAHPAPGGDRYRFTMANGYGASVVRFLIEIEGMPPVGSYGAERGLWELAVIGPDGDLTYSTPITEDVMGHLTEDDVSRVLAEIAALPRA